MTTIAAETIGPARLVAVGTPEQPPLCALLVDTGKLDSDRARDVTRFTCRAIVEEANRLADTGN